MIKKQNKTHFHIKTPSYVVFQSNLDKSHASCLFIHEVKLTGSENELKILFANRVYLRLAK